MFAKLDGASANWDRRLRGPPADRGPEKVHIWVGQELARKAVDAGLQRWLLARAA